METQKLTKIKNYCTTTYTSKIKCLKHMVLTLAANTGAIQQSLSV